MVDKNIRKRSIKLILKKQYMLDSDDEEEGQYCKSFLSWLYQNTHKKSNENICLQEKKTISCHSKAKEKNKQEENIIDMTDWPEHTNPDSYVKQQAYNNKFLDNLSNEEIQCGYECEICKNKKFFKTYKLLTAHHQKVHVKKNGGHRILMNDNRQYECEICDKYFGHFATDHKEEDFENKGLKMKHFISTKTLQGFVHQQQQKQEKNQIKEKIIKEIKRHNNPKLQINEEEQNYNTFLLEKEKYQLASKLWKKGYQMNNLMPKYKDKPHTLLQQDKAYIVFPMKFLRIKKENQVELYACYEIMKRAKIASLNRLLQLEKIIISQNFIGYQTQKLDSNLEELIQNRQFNENEKKIIIQNILIGITQIQRAGFSHQSIKPKNILISNDLSDIRICRYKTLSYIEELEKFQEEATDQYRPSKNIQWPKGCIFWDTYSLGVIFIDYGKEKKSLNNQQIVKVQKLSYKDFIDISIGTKRKEKYQKNAFIQKKMKQRQFCLSSKNQFMIVNLKKAKNN